MKGPFRISRITLGSLLVAVLAVALFGRSSAAWWARRSAARHLDAGAIGAAERSLAWAAWVNSGDHRTDLMNADCLRRRGERDAWQGAIESAEQHGATGKPLRLARQLGHLRWGEGESISRGDHDALVADGVAPREAVFVVVHGLLAKGARDSDARNEADKLIDALATNPAEEVEAAYLRGICASAAGDREAAQTELASALKQQPLHELAHVALARVFEEQYRLDEALEHYSALRESAPHRELARVDLARVLRKLGRLDDARHVLKPPAAAADASASVALELGEIEYESGKHEAARRWFEQADLEGPHVAESLRAAASNFAYQGDFASSERLFARIDDAQGLSRQVSELQRRIGIDANDANAKAELQHLLAGSIITGPQPETGNGVDARVSALYVEHCAACHGADGEGAGSAARHLHPRPRSLRTEEYRLVSTLNQVPSLEDVEAVIRQGIPGASMPGFAKLPVEQRQQLALDVQQLYRWRFRNRAVQEAGEVLVVPSIGKGTSESIAQGREVYLKSNCQQCHGDDGTGATAAAMFDTAGRPTSPRDLVHEPMKGGPGGESLYRRIRLGMPGTPHPASPSLAAADLIGLVHYCQSLAVEPPRQLTNHERATRDSRRPLTSPSASR